MCVKREREREREKERERDVNFSLNYISSRSFNQFQFDNSFKISKNYNFSPSFLIIKVLFLYSLIYLNKFLIINILFLYFLI